MTTHPLLHWLGFPAREHLHRDVLAYALATSGTAPLLELIGDIGPILPGSLVKEGQLVGSRIDLFFETETHCVAIEVKVRSGESVGQLRRYATQLAQRDTQKQRLLVFITEIGLIPEHLESWQAAFPQVELRTLTWDQVADTFAADDPIHWHTDVIARRTQSTMLTAVLAGTSTTKLDVASDWHLHARALRDFAVDAVAGSQVEHLAHVHGPVGGHYGSKKSVLIDFAKPNWTLTLGRCAGIETANPFNDDLARVSVRLRFAIPVHGRLQLMVGAQLLPYPVGSVRQAVQAMELRADALIRTLARHLGTAPSAVTEAWRRCKLLAEVPRSRRSRTPSFGGPRGTSSSTMIANVVPEIERWLDAQNARAPG